MNDSTSKFGKYHPYDMLLAFAVTIALLASPTSCNQHDERLANGDSEPQPTNQTVPSPAAAASAAPVNSKGKTLFKVNCSSCHYASEKNGTGPGLENVLGRIPGGDWKYKWVKNSAAVTASGDAYAAAIKAKWNNAAMTAFPSLSNEDIDAILEYADAGDGK
ncbi:MAG: c-type cytochrome [Bacteroidia bacterium]